MGQVGVGLKYTTGFLCQPLREQSTKALRQELLDQYYIPHHQKLTEAVEEVLFDNNHCLIVDGRGFPAFPILYELNKSTF